MNAIHAKNTVLTLALITCSQAIAAGKSATEIQSDIENLTEKTQKEQKNIESKAEKAAPAMPPGSKLGETAPARQSVDLPSPPQGVTSPNPERAPLVTTAPPPTIRAWLGEELNLTGSAKGIDKGPEKTYFAWILNGVVVCQQRQCRIPLDGRAIAPGAHQLLFVAYNIQGSSISKHTLFIQKSSWNATIPLRSKNIESEEVEAKIVRLQPLNSNSLHLTMMQGNAVHAYPENVIVVGSVPRNIPWEGQIKTAPRGVARINEPKTGRWFVLGNGQMNFVPNKMDPNDRTVSLDKGTMRAQSIEKADSQKKVERNNIAIATKEARVFLDPGVDIAIVRIAPPPEAMTRRATAKSLNDIAKADQFQTRIVSISGTVRFQLPASNGQAAKVATIPPGVELVISEDGKVGPFERPKPEFMEKLLKQTMTPEELAERARRKAEAQKKVVDINEVIKKVEEFSARSDYFEMLNELATIEDRRDEDVRISYNLGLANKGLYQPLEAEKHFRYALNQDKNFPDPAWQIGLMALDEKKWSDAADAFSEAKSRMSSSDKRSEEYHYYAGVAQYNIPSDFSARNNFTRALLWDSNLEQSLKASSGEFLKKLRERKDWSIAVPLGVQWDGNALALASDASIPAGYSQKYLLRGIAGVMFNWDPSATREAPGWYNAATTSVMYAHHYPNQFKAFNSIILGAGASQIRKSVHEIPESEPKKDEKPDTAKADGSNSEKQKTENRVLKVYENVQASVVNKSFALLTFTGGINYLSLDTSLGFEKSMAADGNSTIVGKEAYSLKLWASPSGLSSDLDLASEQRLALKTSASAGHAFSATATPSLTIPMNMITNAKVSSAFGAKKALYGAETLSLNAAPSAALTRFITPWMVGILSAGYEVVYEMDSIPTGSKARTVLKPSASLMFSGVF